MLKVLSEKSSAAILEAEAEPKPTTKIYYRVTVPDSGTPEAGDVVIKLNGIVAHTADAQCQDEKAKNWPCGAVARAALRRLIRARAVVCDLPEPGEQKSFTARCAVSRTDLSAMLIEIDASCARMPGVQFTNGNRQGSPGLRLAGAEHPDLGSA